MTPSERPALDLPRLVMRRALVVAAFTLAAAIVMGLLRAGTDIDEETEAAQSLASVMAQLATLPAQGDAQAIAALRRTLARQPLRHLQLTISRGDGRSLLAPPAEAADAAPLRWLIALHRGAFADAPREAVSWAVPQADGTRWTVTLAPSRASERREAIADVLSLVLVLLLGGATMLGVMAFNVNRALRPLQSLLGAIGGVQRGDSEALRRLPAMPIRELQVLASALQSLGEALAAAEAERRMLGQKVLGLQEDERHRLARELHDEFGQRLTALRVDLTWLQRRLRGEDELLQVVQGMVTHCEHIQRDIRQLLARLQPLGPSAGAADAGDEPLERLVESLQALVDGWSRSGEQQTRLAVEIAEGAPPALPRATALALYRISQEALTNVARHARARHATLSLAVHPAGDGGATIDWSVSDDGVGLADPASAQQRGNGLAGIKERVWALGGDLQWQAEARGLTLRAKLPLRAEPREKAH